MKLRLDQLLFQRGLFDSREKARSVIMAGLVYIQEQKYDKPGTKVDENVEVMVKAGHVIPYVSRGGLKLEKALSVFPLNLKDKVCLDIGASTGGFTDCMLQNGAARVYAIDVGYGQLDWKLRNDPRVICMERTNIRHVTPEQLPEKADFASIDVSFISLRLVLPAVKALLKPEGELVALIKPQFEAGREKVGKKGVVKDLAVHQEVVENLVQFSRELAFQIQGLDFSPIKGPEGNIEYLLHLSLAEPGPAAFDFVQISQVVNASHQNL